MYLSKLTSGDVLVTLQLTHGIRTVNALKINMIEADQIRNEQLSGSHKRTAGALDRLEASNRRFAELIAAAEKKV